MAHGSTPTGILQFPFVSSTVLAACFALCGVWASSALALPKVEHHELVCGDTFPCPPEIRRRVDFWIKVFRTWNTNQVVFHDTRQPERVYSVKTTKATCRRKGAASAIERERRRIRARLRSVAAKLKQKHPRWTADEQQMLSLFPKRDAAEVARAAKEIRCQQGNRDRFKDALERYGQYRDHILGVLQESGLSEDILYLPFVESAYNPKAYSRVGAAGLWQIMPRTARKLGLQLNSTIDERFDPEAATWAAARYLRKSTDILTAAAAARQPGISASQINPFVITSYNYGVAGMRRAIKEIGPDYVAVLRRYRSRNFRTAVRNFYSSFLAARYVAQNADKYFGPVQSKAQRASVVSLKRATSAKRAAKVFGVSERTLKTFNPALTRNVWRGWRLIPEGYALRLPHRSHDYARQLAKLAKMKPEQPGLSGKKYVVQRGDTACGIADIFNVRCRDLVRLNGLGRRALIRVGQKLDIPASQPRKTKVASAPAAKPAPKPKAGAAGDRPRRVSRATPDSTKPSPSESAAVAVVDKAASPGDPKLSTDDVFERLVRNIDVRLRSARVKGKTRYSLIVEPEETLGHYSDWLGLGTTSRIRKLNGIGWRKSIRVGQRLRLPIKDEATVGEFEAKRAEYHRTLVDEFQEHYEILSVENYVVKRGDSIWRVAREYELPYWVLTRLNPRAGSPDIGDRLAVPVARARKPSKEPPISDRG